MASHQAQAQFSRYFAQLILEAFRLGYAAVINEVSRTVEQQKLYVEQGKSKTMQSKHLERCAGDVLLFKSGKYLTEKPDYASLGAYWKGLNPKCKWGGDWGWDANHFEYDETP